QVDELVCRCVLRQRLQLGRDHAQLGRFSGATGAGFVQPGGLAHRSHLSMYRARSACSSACAKSICDAVRFADSPHDPITTPRWAILSTTASAEAISLVRSSSRFSRTTAR